MILPEPELKIRVPEPTRQQAGAAEGLHPLLAKILASRPKPDDIDLTQMLLPKLSDCLDHPLLMADMDKASQRVMQAIINQECIGLETDHDCDGQTSHAVLYYNLVERFGLPSNLIKSYIGHRLKEGYGLSDSVAKRILQDSPRPSLVITADNGSSDEPRIKLLQDVGIDVVVTDHHQLPVAGPPASAYACLNPTRDDCQYQDKFIAGCMVAWLLMAATRIKLIAAGYLPATTPKLLDSLDFVAVGTVADCVSLARSKNNRAVVYHGLRLINQAERPCWRAILPLVNNDTVKSQDLGFVIGPLLNSDGRLSSAFGSVSFLLAKTDAEASQWVEYLQEQNIERKAIQRQLLDAGIIAAGEQVAAGKYGICIYLDNGHPGVHGIAASKIKEKFGRPTVFLADKHGNQDLITGSVRGIDGFNVRLGLQQIADLVPEMLIAFGGHVAAGGVTLQKSNLPLFIETFEQVAKQQLDQNKIGPVIWTDGELPAELINLETVKVLEKLEPYGREFEAPVFLLQGYLDDLRFIGDGTHARLTLVVEQMHKFQGVWFNCRQQPGAELAVAIGDFVRCAFTMEVNNFRNLERCELKIYAVMQCKVLA